MNGRSAGRPNESLEAALGLIGRVLVIRARLLHGEIVPDMPDKTIVGRRASVYVDDEQQAAFHAALGSAISSWQSVESALARVYDAAILPLAPDAAMAAFHQIQTFKMKLQTTDLAVRCILLKHEKAKHPVAKPHLPEIAPEWTKLYKRMEDKSQRRNELAPFFVYIVYNKRSKNERIRLRPQLHDTRFRLGLRPNVDHGVEEIKCFSALFLILGKEVSDFSLKLRSIAKALHSISSL